MNEFDVPLERPAVTRLEKAAEAALEDGLLLVDANDDTAPDPEPIVSLTKEQYVEREVEITRRQYGHDPNLEERLVRSKAYCEWRWDGFRAGTIGSL